MSICVVCGHDLDNHIDEETGGHSDVRKWWRCHNLGVDWSQCECRLLKIIAEEDGIDWYNLQKREAERIKEMTTSQEKRRES